jgi:hypothetical protein
VTVAKVKITIEMDIDPRFLEQDGKGKPAPGFAEQYVFDHLIKAAELHHRVSNLRIITSKTVDAETIQAMIRLNDIHLDTLSKAEQRMTIEYLPDTP